jgi:hypothetical protein
MGRRRKAFGFELSRELSGRRRVGRGPLGKVSGLRFWFAISGPEQVRGSLLVKQAVSIPRILFVNIVILTNLTSLLTPVKEFLVLNFHHGLPRSPCLP